ncbi:MAG: hypothetical protein A2X36_08005 [Elusimicrobia bacterium GWA2_69_24]|nr:MAG: hypothetical protein A2X36_08005 [Elusimicrobia bacterium GWA2_69_24]HBL18881.1 hypothetical protein [Elusimicrobiota bacterium]
MKPPDPFLPQGIARFNAGDYPGAAAAFGKSVAAGSRDPLAHSFLAHSYSWLGRHKEAVAVLKRALREEPQEEALLRALSEVLERAGRGDEAADCLRRLAGGKKAGPVSARELGELCLREGKSELAVRHLKELVGAEKDSSPSHLLLARALDASGQTGPAEASFREAVRLDPRSGEARSRLGDFLFRRERFQEAEAALRDAIRLQPEDAEPRILLGRVLESLGETAMAEAAFQDAVGRAQDPSPALLRLGGLYLKERRLDEAEAKLRAALKRNARSPEASVLLGRVMEARGRDAEALKLFKRAAEAEPPGAEAFATLGEFCRQRGRREEAESHLREALRLGGGQPRLYLLLADLQRESGRLDEAARTCEEAAGLWPADPSLSFRLGQLCEQMGDAERLRGAYRKFLALPEDRRGPRVYSFMARMALGEYKRAFAEAEKLTEDWDCFSADRIFYPWDEDSRFPRAEGFYLERLPELRALEKRLPDSPWPRFYQGILQCRLHRKRRGLSLLDEVLKSDEKRYGWMRFAAGVERLEAGHYREAIEDLEASLRSRSAAWWARCRLAEARLCLGQTDAALAEFARAEAIGPEGAAQCLAWRGEALLWLGRYAEAAELCGRALPGGSRFASCWRGAALLLSGKLDAARADLDQSVAQDSGDAESLVWRGEFHRRAGDPPAALADLDRAVALRAGTWAHVNRALVRRELGDEDGMWEDFDAIPEAVLTCVEGNPKSPARRGRDADAVVRLLELALKQARGVRRCEPYLYPLWMR